MSGGNGGYHFDPTERPGPKMLCQTDDGRWEPAITTVALLGDFRDLLDALGLFSGARPESAHDVFQNEVLPRVRRLMEMEDAAITMRDRIDDIAQAQSEGSATDAKH